MTTIAFKKEGDTLVLGADSLAIIDPNVKSYVEKIYDIGPVTLAFTGSRCTIAKFKRFLAANIGNLEITPELFLRGFPDLDTTSPRGIETSCLRIIENQIIEFDQKYSIARDERIDFFAVFRSKLIIIEACWVDCVIATRAARCDLPCYGAIGCGRDFAIGAMAAGATAIEALDIASRYDSTTGGDLRIRTFHMSEELK